MLTLVWIIAALWMLRILANILSYTQLWRVKEYRYDRMLIHLRTAQGKRILFLPFKRPAITPKTIVVALLTGISAAGVFFLLPFHVLLRVALIDLLSFPLSAFIVGLVQLPTILIHEWKIARAKEKLQAMQHLLVIGVTGSYGKTSTKEMLAAILSAKYRVLKTEKSRNSPIAIAETVLSELTAEHTIFIVEMGAYKQGEIAKMCSMTHPQIGIVTAINEQHQDLFGSIEGTMKAKFELVAGLTGKKVVVMNADNPHVRTMGDWAVDAGRHVVWYSKEKLTKLYATDIKQEKNMLSFMAHYDKHKKIVTVPLFGVHHVSNILAALAAAMQTGMTFDEAVEATKQIVAYEKTMQPMKGASGSLFINDTFNNNPDAAIAAINALAGAGGGKKYIVFQPMIELGAFAEAAHTRVGARAAEVADAIYLTNWNFHDAFVQGVRSVNADIPVSVLSAAGIAEKLGSTVQKDDAVLFKGKEAEASLKLLV